MYGIIYEWTLPATVEEIELINDFKTIKQLAVNNGALASYLYKDLKNNKYMGIQIWPSKKEYDDFFDQENFSFQDSQPEEYIKLAKKIKETYKNHFLEEISPIV